MKTYLVKIYYRNIVGKIENKEVVYSCDEEDLNKYIKQEVKVLEKNGENVATDVSIFLYIGQMEYNSML